DGIRDRNVTGVQTCALPISTQRPCPLNILIKKAEGRIAVNQARKEIHCEECWREGYTGRGIGVAVLDTGIFPHEDFGGRIAAFRSEERRVGKEWRWLGEPWE